MARNEDERVMIYLGNMKPGEACCGNCGWACPPWNPDLDGRYANCAFPSYQDFPLKPATAFYRCWTDDASVGVVPEWCEPYTKRRLTKEEIDANLSPQAVVNRIHAQENNGTFKRKTAEHLQASSGPPQQTSDDPDALPFVSDFDPNVKPSISDVVKLQEKRIESAWTGISRLEIAPRQDQWPIANELKAQLRIMDAEIANMIRSL